MRDEQVQVSKGKEKCVVEERTGGHIQSESSVLFISCSEEPQSCFLYL